MKIKPAIRNRELVMLAAAFALVPACTIQARIGTRNGGDPPPSGSGSASQTEQRQEAPEAGQPSTSKAPRPERAKVTLKGHKLLLEDYIDFDADSSAPTPDSVLALNEVKAYLDQNPRVTQLRIAGHTDNQRPADASMQLSGRRAVAIKGWLVQAGIAPERLLAVGFGSDVPIASNATPEGQAQNERIDFHIAQLDGKPYLGLDPLAGGTEFQ